MYNRECVDLVNRLFEQKRKNADENAKNRRLEAETLIPELSELNRKIASIGMRVFEEALAGGENLPARIEKLKDENRALQKRQGDLLEKAGLPRDYTKIRHECEKCGDSGFIGVNMCSCMKRAIVLEGYRASGLEKLLQRQNFDSFRLDLYSDELLPEKRYSARDVMSGILESCRDYARDFSLSSPSLLFIGGTGLGKTHLSSAIAKEVIDKGFDVAYESAPNVVAAFEKERFRAEGEECRTQRFFDAELLILDDLGTEPGAKTTQAFLYNLINTRASVTSRPTVISTNLYYKQLEKQYDSPIISRLFGEFEVKLFCGADVRRARL